VTLAFKTRDAALIKAIRAKAEDQKNQEILQKLARFRGS
jgi:hypothetical protein